VRIRRRFLHNHDVEEELGSVLCSEQLESVVGECLPQRRFSPISDSCSRHTLGVVTPDVLRDETPAVTLASRVDIQRVWTRRSPFPASWVVGTARKVRERA